MIVKTVKDTEGIPLPAISLMFTNDAPEIQKYKSCYQTNDSVVDCLQTNAPDVSMLLKKTMLGYTKKKRLFWGKDNITSTLDDSRAGIVYTLNFPLSIGPDDDQGCIFRLTCSYPELTEDHVLTSAYVKFFRTVTRNAVNNSA